MKNWKLNYKTAGIILLVLSILNILPFLAIKLIIENIKAQMVGKPIYFVIVVSIMNLLNLAINVWGAMISIKLIKENKYNKQILYFVYGLAGISFLAFLLYLPLGRISIFDLVLGFLTYYFGIKHKNNFSRFVKGE